MDNGYHKQTYDAAVVVEVHPKGHLATWCHSSEAPAQ